MSSSSSFKLSALFRSAVKSANKVAASAKDASLKNVLSSIDSSSSSSSPSSSPSTSSTITDTLRRLSDSPAGRHSRPNRTSPKLARSKSVSSPEANAAEPFGTLVVLAAGKCAASWRWREKFAVGFVSG